MLHHRNHYINVNSCFFWNRSTLSLQKLISTDTYITAHPIYTCTFLCFPKITSINSMWWTNNIKKMFTFPGCSRLNTPLAATTTLEDPGTPASWKGPPPGSEASPFTPNSVGQGGGPGSGPYNNTGGPPSNAAFQGPSPFPGGAGSPAGAPPYQGPPPGSATPQYTASPAPSGSSTPGPGPPPNSSGFPPPPNNSGPPYNGPGPSPFGSPSGGPPQFVGRPGSSGPPFVPPGAGNPHFPSHGQPFGGPQYGMPPGSPFGPGHPMTGPIGPGHPAMMGPGGPVDRMDQG